MLKSLQFLQFLQFPPDGRAKYNRQGPTKDPQTIGSTKPSTFELISRAYQLLRARTCRISIVSDRSQTKKRTLLFLCCFFSPAKLLHIVTPSLSFLSFLSFPWLLYISIYFCFWFCFSTGNWTLYSQWRV